jgi:hypothetical protein
MNKDAGWAAVHGISSVLYKHKDIMNYKYSPVQCLRPILQQQAFVRSNKQDLAFLIVLKCVNHRRCKLQTLYLQHLLYISEWDICGMNLIDITEVLGEKPVTVLLFTPQIPCGVP